MGMNKIQMIPIELLHPHPQNPRKELGDLTELADSIREKGVYQNLTVVPDGDGYTLIIGHRRCAASKVAGLKELPCAVVEMSEQEQLSTMLLENMQRSDLTPYEQAQGFQLMIDMGDTPEGIAQKTGFSKATVRRRLKMAELDQTVLKEVSDRQISLEDFDALAKINDIKARNELLKNIGTPNFAIECRKRIKKQNIAKNLPWVKKAIRKLGAKSISYSQTYYGDYRGIGEDIQIDELKEEVLNAPDPGEKKLHYHLDEDSGRLRFYIERDKPAPVRRPQEEIDREKAKEEANDRCAELSALFYQLRSQFIHGIRYSAKNKDAILTGAVSAIVSMGFKYANVSSTKLCQIIGEERKWCSGERKRITDLLMADPAKHYPGIVYAAYDDSEKNGYHTTYKKQWPRKQDNETLDVLYAWLISMGYVMSDEEKAMQEGTHHLLKLEDGNYGNQ